MNNGSVIREVCAEDHILWQLPHRSLPTQEANAVGTWRYIATILATISLFAAWHFMIGPLNFGVLIAVWGDCLVHAVRQNRGIGLTRPTPCR